MIRLLGRPALSIDGRASHLVGVAHGEPRVAHHVAGLLAGLGHATADDLFQILFVDSRFLQDPSQ